MKWRELFNVIIVSILIMILLVTVPKLNDWYKDRVTAKTEEETLKELVVINKDENNLEEEDKDLGIFGEDIDFNKLKDINSDTFAWIRNKGTINYPVVLSEDGQDYLNRSFYGEKSSAGTIFTLDTTKATDDNLSLYGHTMGRTRDDFFASLHKYKDESYREEFKDFQVLTPDGIREFEVFALFEMDIANDTFNPFISNFYTLEDKRDFFNTVKDKSVIPIDYQFSFKDDYLTLMTCLKGGRDITDRLIVMAIEK